MTPEEYPTLSSNPDDFKSAPIVPASIVPAAVEGMTETFKIIVGENIKDKDLVQWMTKLAEVAESGLDEGWNLKQIHEIIEQHAALAIEALRIKGGKKSLGVVREIVLTAVRAAKAAIVPTLP